MCNQECIYIIINFFLLLFLDLIEDWASKAQPDLLHFVPYTWSFGLKLMDFELVTLANEYNWVDCSSTQSSQHPSNGNIIFFLYVAS